ncbi:hypothetical protein VNI00_002517 [Paramarasmius palmivorus]|uniref:Uncharacterized protein n=1 Tax=Paramarasmius palmivorus TaxID=297713 RepID=A0AAW0DXN9_9AGAR
MLIDGLITTRYHCTPPRIAAWLQQPVQLSPTASTFPREGKADGGKLALLVQWCHWCAGQCTESEVAALLYLIRSPDAHFLKVPFPPFQSFTSVLHEFLADVNNRVFWSGNLRDVSSAAIQVLMARVEARKDDNEYNRELGDDLVDSSLQSKVRDTFRQIIAVDQLVLL